MNGTMGAMQTPPIKNKFCNHASHNSCMGSSTYQRKKKYLIRMQVLTAAQFLLESPQITLSLALGGRVTHHNGTFSLKKHQKLYPIEAQFKCPYTPA